MNVETAAENPEFGDRKATIDYNARVSADVDGVNAMMSWAILNDAIHWAVMQMKKPMSPQEIILWRKWPAGPDGRELLVVIHP
jgi:hypothetical protein